MKIFGQLILILVLATSTLQPLNAQIEQQRASNWCWAACIQSVLYQAGRYYTQEQIVATLDGWPRDRPANNFEIIALLQYFGLRAWEVGRVASPLELYQSLGSGYKLLASVKPLGGQIGHCIVLQGFTPEGFIIVSDPATGMTFTNTLNDLYYSWGWVDVVLVGR